MTPEQMKELQQKVRLLRNDKFIEAAKVVKSDKELNPKHQTELADAILVSRFIIPAIIQDNEANPNKARVTFSQIGNEKGEKYFMLFSDFDTLKLNVKDYDKISLLSVTYKDLVKMLSAPGCNAIGFVVNPFTENIVIGPEQGNAIGKYVREKNFAEGKSAVFRGFENIPDEVVLPIEKYLDARGDVKKAYIVCMQKAKEVNRVVFIHTDDGVDFKELAKDFIENVLKNMNDDKMPFIVMDYNTELGKKATEQNVPVYVRV